MTKDTRRCQFCHKIVDAPYDPATCATCAREYHIYPFGGFHSTGYVENPDTFVSPLGADKPRLL